MLFVPKKPKKVQYLLDFSYPQIELLCPRKPFIGGRIGYDKQLLFMLLLIKKVTNWSYRTLAEMGGISHSTLVRANEKFFIHLVKTAYRKGLIKGRFMMTRISETGFSRNSKQKPVFPWREKVSWQKVRKKPIWESIELAIKSSGAHI